MRYEEPTPKEGPKDSDPRALREFRSELERSGDFIEHETYGSVWVPDRSLVGADFSPYVTNGHWALDSNGAWVWESDFGFGRIVFHYGRWVWIEGTGWAWIPGFKYAPAWVDWRVPDEESPSEVDYVGWAPTPPSYVWFRGAPYAHTYVPPPYWVFCPSAFAFVYPLWPHVVHDHHHAHHAARHTRPYAPAHGAGHAHGPPPATAKVPPLRIPTERVRAPERIAREQRPAHVRQREEGKARASDASRSERRGVVGARSVTRTDERGSVPQGSVRSGPRPDRERVGPRVESVRRVELSRPMHSRSAADAAWAGRARPHALPRVADQARIEGAMRAAPVRSPPMRTRPSVRAVPTRTGPSLRAVPTHSAPMRAAPPRGTGRGR